MCTKCVQTSLLIILYYRIKNHEVATQWGTAALLAAARQMVRISRAAVGADGSSTLAESSALWLRDQDPEPRQKYRRNSPNEK